MIATASTTSAPLETAPVEHIVPRPPRFMLGRAPIDRVSMDYAAHYRRAECVPRHAG
jgi:hypothetical protein